MPRWWTTRLVPTSFTNPYEPGEPLYVFVNFRPRWWMWLLRTRLFLGILWRIPTEGGAPVDWQTARDVSYVVYPKSRRRSAPKEHR